MKHQLLQGTEKIVCNLELTLIETKEELEAKQQKIKELQSLLRDKENEINFLKDILSSRTTLISHQVNTIYAMQEKISKLQQAEPPVIVMNTYVPEKELSETAV
jgi:hypothetical protein